MMLCQLCGTRLEEGQLTCPNCGHVTTPGREGERLKEKKTDAARGAAPPRGVGDLEVGGRGGARGRDPPGDWLGPQAPGKGKAKGSRDHLGRASPRKPELHRGWRGGGDHLQNLPDRPGGGGWGERTALEVLSRA